MVYFWKAKTYLPTTIYQHVNIDMCLGCIVLEYLILKVAVLVADLSIIKKIVK